MNIKEKLVEYGLTEKQYEELMEDIQSIKDGTCKCESDKWQYLVDKYNLVWNKDSLRKSQDIIGGIFAYNYMKEKYSKENTALSEDEYFKELEMKKREIEKEKQKLQDQKREYRNLIRVDARFDHLVETIKEEISKLDKEPYLNSYIDDGSERYTCASLLLSDWHCGLEIYDTLNTFNFEILKERVSALRDRVITYCKKQNVYELNIELLGDMVNGYLHNSARCFNEEDVITQTIKVSELLAEMIDDFALYIPVINIYTTIGNHGRTSSNIKDSIQVENFERLITWHLQSTIKCENVRVHNCEVDYISYELMNGKFVVGSHGNLDKPNQIANNYIRMYKKIPDYIHLGHTHFYQENDDSDINVIVNGMLSGTDQFAKTIRKSNKPCQVLIVYGEQDDCVYKMKF